RITATASRSSSSRPALPFSQRTTESAGRREAGLSITLHQLSWAGAEIDATARRRRAPRRDLLDAGGRAGIPKLDSRHRHGSVRQTTARRRDSRDERAHARVAPRQDRSPWTVHVGGGASGSVPADDRAPG